MKKNLQQYKTGPLIKKSGGTLVQQEQIKNQLTILPELEALIPPLLPDEMAQLEANIIHDGCREPLLVWHTSGESIGHESETCYVLIDGHNRLGICERNGIDFKIAIREFADLPAVKNFMIDNQLGRRNLTPEQMSYLRGLKYLAAKKKGGRVRQEEPASPAVEDTGEYIRTMDVLAEQFQVSPRTIMSDASFAKGVEKLTPGFKQSVLSRSVRVSKKELAALGELKQVHTPINTREELSHALKSAKRDKEPAANTTVIEQKIARINSHMAALSYPSPTLETTCEDLIAALADLLEELRKQTPA